MSYDEIATVQELEFLPVRTILLCDDDSVARLALKDSNAWEPDVEFNRWDLGGGMLHIDDMVDLPAKVLWRPDASGVEPANEAQAYLEKTLDNIEDIDAHWTAAEVRELLSDTLNLLAGPVTP